MSARSSLGCAVAAWILLLMANTSVSATKPHSQMTSSRFGDTTWVAPTAPPDASDPEARGPRVAPRDHERGWETVMRTPFRVAFLPMRLIARGAEAGVAR